MAAPTFGGASQGSAAPGLTCTISAFTTTGSNLGLWVWVGIIGQDVGNTVSGITYGADNFPAALAVKHDAGNGSEIQLWRLAGFSPRTNDIVVTQSQSNSIVAGAQYFTGVDQSTPNGTPVVASGTSNTQSCTVSSSVNAIVADGIQTASDAGTITANGDNTGNQRFTVDTGDTLLRGSSATGATSVNMSWSWPTGTYNNQIAVSINGISATPGFKLILTQP